MPRPSNPSRRRRASPHVHRTRYTDVVPSQRHVGHCELVSQQRAATTRGNHQTAASSARLSHSKHRYKCTLIFTIIFYRFVAFYYYTL